MNIEQKINSQLQKYPELKKIIKRCYQLACYTCSPKIKSEGHMTSLCPNDGMEYFFGYYDKTPWDESGRYVLCLRAKDTSRYPDPVEPAELVLIDSEANMHITHLSYTHAWNVQQGCMAQWLDVNGGGKKIIFNDFNGGGYYCSYVLDINTGKKQELSMPVYTVSADGKIALTLDFARLHNLRPGYGYAILPEKTKDVPLPDETCIWRMSIETGEVVPLLKYTDFAKFQPRPEMQEKGSVHKVNHLMLSPNGKRFMVLYRWFCGHRKYTRLITCNVDGTDMYLLSDDDMVSHCYWKNDDEIIAFENKNGEGPGYYLMKDKTQEWRHLWPQLNSDGHPSYSPTDDDLVVFDTYPSRSRIQEVKICRDTDIEGKDLKVVARVLSPFKYDNDTRCDLHPRWSRDGKKVCFDSVFEGHRGLYVVEIGE